MVAQSKDTRAPGNRFDRNLLIATGIVGVLAVALSISAYWLSPFPGDLKLTLWFQSIHSNALLRIMEWFSFIAGSWHAAVLVVIGCGILWWRVGRREAVLAAAAGLTTFVDFALKIIIGKLRPPSSLINVFVVVQGNGYPSGHAFFSMVFLGLMAYFAYNYILNPAVRRTIVASLIVVILMIGLSRIYLGAHWPSDVLGGYLLGATFLGMFIWLDRKYNRKDVRVHQT